jgi:hypothetical protein
MDSAMISKIEKAKRYAEEPQRVSIQSMTVSFRGDNNTHTVSYDRGQWHCGCHFFSQRGVCSHTMALERIFGERLAGLNQTEESSH